MPIPDYEQCMLPLLKIAEDGKEHLLKDTIEVISELFKLSEAERTKLLPSGSAFVINSRISWARTYLTKAKLLDAPKRGYFQITERGKKFLKENPKVINAKLLKQFEEFKDFQSRKTEKNNNSEASEIEAINNVTPQELIENGYMAIRHELSEELLNLLKKISPSRFERIVVELLVKMGYGGSFKEAATVVGKSGDAGIDGIIKEDKLGLDVIYIQAKKWEGTVGRPEIQKFAGALMGRKAKKGIFITTSDFSSEAKGYAENIDVKIILIDGNLLASLMIENDLGVSTQNTYEIKRIDSDYFEEE